VPPFDGQGLLWGNGIKLGYDEDPVSHRVIRSVSWANNGAGFHMNAGPATILGASSYGNRVFGFDFTDGARHEIRNSWEFDNELDPPEYIETPPDLSLSSHNSWDGTIEISVGPDDFVTVDDAGMLGPRLPDGSLPASLFLRLAPGSDLIDAGMDVGLAFSSTAPDIGAFEFEGPGTAVTAAVAASLPDRFEVASHPNPFNPRVTVRFELPQAGHVDVSVYDVAGQRVAQLDAGYRPAGSHTLTWDARLEDGRQVASGTYLLRVEAGAAARTVKMAYVR
jgi:hypothetical protein